MSSAEWNVPHNETAMDERREYSRFAKEPDSDYALIWIQPGEERLVEVINESLGGICIAVADPHPFAVGIYATILYQSSLMRGEVRHMNQRDDGKYLIGFACQR